MSVLLPELRFMCLRSAQRSATARPATDTVRMRSLLAMVFERTVRPIGWQRYNAGGDWRYYPPGPAPLPKVARFASTRE